MANTGLKATLAGLLALGASGCMTMGGYGAGYGDGYYNDGYGANGYAYNDRCYDAYDGYDNYYSQYDCYDSNDYNSRFSVNIGFGGGWWNDFYYPGYGYYMFDRYGARRQLYGNYARYWGGRRAGYNWQRHGGHRDRQRDGRRGERSERRDRSGVGGQIVDRVGQANGETTRGRRAPRATTAPEAVERRIPETRRPTRQIVDRVDRANRRTRTAAPQTRTVDRPARVEAAPATQPVARPAARVRTQERRSTPRRERQEPGRVQPD